jgi:hypothetical protein
MATTPYGILLENKRFFVDERMFYLGASITTNINKIQAAMAPFAQSNGF